MNETFKKLKSKKIELDDTFYLLPDGFKGLVLQREVEKTRKKKDSGEKETYLDSEQWYFPTISQTLNHYLKLKSVDAQSVENLRDIVLRVEDKINKIKEQWN